MRKLALLIGVDSYEDVEVTPLRFASADATAVAETLKSQCGFDRTIVLTETHGASAATKSRILSALRSLSGELRSDDLFVFYFGGHGIESDGHAYLLTSDSQRAFLEETGLGLSSLRKSFGHLPARQRALILDCCRNDPAAGRGDGDNFMGDCMSRDILAVARAGEEGVALPPTTVVLSACSKGQRAYEFPLHGHGVFTYYLLNGLRGAAWTGGRLTLSGLGRYAAEEVAQWSRNTTGTGPQIPWCEQVGFAEIVLAEGTSTASATGPVTAPPPLTREQIISQVWEEGQAAGLSFDQIYRRAQAQIHGEDEARRRRNEIDAMRAAWRPSGD